MDLALKGNWLHMGLDSRFLEVPDKQLVGLHWLSCRGVSGMGRCARWKWSYHLRTAKYLFVKTRVFDVIWTIIILGFEGSGDAGGPAMVWRKVVMGSAQDRTATKMMTCRAAD